MLDVSSSVAGVGFSPLNYAELWAAAGQPGGSKAAEQVGSPDRTTTRAATSRYWDASESAAGVSSVGISAADLQVQLAVARLRAAAEQVARDRALQLAAGGGYVRGGGSFSYTIGPDGQLYASGVVLAYDTTPVADDPQATIEKMRQVRAAALATRSPSASDLAAAATATQVELQARLELSRALAATYTGAAQDTSGGLLSAFA